MTAYKIADHFGATYKTICITLKTVYGVYIDRWSAPKRGQYAAVYMCVETPKNAPHPKGE